MCGLFGVATSEARKEEFSRKSAFRHGLQLQEWRGEDATGVALVHLNGLKSTPVIYKKAMAASDFIRLSPYKKLVDAKFDEYAFVLGHARSATYGRGESDQDSNAHPFCVDSVTLTHNGHIRNYRTLNAGVDSDVDSAHVAAALSDAEQAKEVLEQLEGGFAFVWHDARDGTLNFARNQERPLWWCYVENENTMFWGSELEGIYNALKHNNIKIDGKFRHCTAQNHFKFDIKNLREFTRVPFVLRPYQAATHTSIGCASAWREGRRHLGDRTASTKDLTSVASELDLTQARTPLIRTVVEELQQSMTDEQTADSVTYLNRATRPTSHKKLRRAKEALARLGRRMDNPQCFIPTQFVRYKNQTPHRGVIYGKEPTGNLRFMMPNVLECLWDVVRGKRLYGRISTVVTEKHSRDEVIVCDFAPDLQERFVTRYTAAKAALKNTQSVEEFDGDSILMFEGPLGRKISKEDFEARTKDGCSHCGCDIGAADASKIVWAGTLGQYPICAECLTDSNIIAMFGSIA